MCWVNIVILYDWYILSAYCLLLGPTAEEISAARKRAEAERLAAEEAEKLRREQEIFERRKQREEKMMEWVCRCVLSLYFLEI